MGMLAAIGPVLPGPHVPPVAVADLPPPAAERQSPRAGAGSAIKPPLGTESRAGAAGMGAPSPARPDPFLLTGPPPAFRANVLERDRAFRDVLARLELARSQREATSLAAGGAAPGRAAGKSPAKADEPPGRDAVQAQTAATPPPATGKGDLPPETATAAAPGTGEPPAGAPAAPA